MIIKAFFAASSDVSQPILNKYMSVLSIMEKSGLKVEQVFLQKKRYDLSNGEVKYDRIYTDVINTINKSDIFVADISYPSGGVGYQIYHAYYQKKPIIIIYTENKKTNPSMMIRGIKSKKIYILKYNDIDNLKEQLPVIINKACKQLKTRFNLVLSNYDYLFLEKTAKSYKISKTRFINNLIKVAKKQIIRNHGEKKNNIS